MSVTKEELQALFREAAAEEFQDIPGEEVIDYSFSDSFEEKADKLLRSAKRPGWKWINTAAKRVAIAAILIVAVFASAFSVKAIREPVARFITKVYEHCVFVLIDGKMNIQITDVYTLTEPPAGYTKAGQLSSSYIVHTTYQDAEGNLLHLDQTTAAVGAFPVDTQVGTLTSTSIGGIPVLLYEAEGFVQVHWVYDRYFFSFTHFGPLDKDTVLALIPQVQKMINGG